MRIFLPRDKNWSESSFASYFCHITLTWSRIKASCSYLVLTVLQPRLRRDVFIRTRSVTSLHVFNVTLKTSTVIKNLAGHSSAADGGQLTCKTSAAHRTIKGLMMSYAEGDSNGRFSGLPRKQRHGETAKIDGVREQNGKWPTPCWVEVVALTRARPGLLSDWLTKQFGAFREKCFYFSLNVLFLPNACARYICPKEGETAELAVRTVYL